MLNAASENVLMAAEACKFERVGPTLGQIAAHTSPHLTVDEVRPIVRLLVTDGYLRTDHDGDPLVVYELTKLGSDEARLVAAASRKEPS